MISPLLANIVLHYVLDEWFLEGSSPYLKGAAFLIRYADDLVIGVAREDDARRIMNTLPKRMSKYGLTVHPGRTPVGPVDPADAADSRSQGVAELDRSADIRFPRVSPITGAEA